MARIKSSPKAFNWLLFLALALAIVVTQALIAFGVTHFISGWPERGQFGDTFGVTNSLFSGLALAGLVCTIVLQQEQIEAQRSEADDLRIDAAASLEGQVRSSHLAMLTFLILHYDARIAKVENSVAEGPSGAALATKKADLLKRRASLEHIISSLHDEVEKSLGGN